MSKSCLFLLWLIPALAAGQFGLRLNYSTLKFADWDKEVAFAAGSNTEDILTPQIEIGMDYWFRLKEKRIEFMPELAYNRAKSENNLGKFQQTLLILYLNSHIYPLDFAGDCNCPTFSKEGNSINKGFFVSLAPFIGINNQSSDSAFSSDAKFNGIIMGVRGGLGIDFGVNDLVTISPNVNYSWIPSIEWTGVDANLQEFDRISAGKGIQAGLRMGLRFDYRSKGRRRR